MKIGMIGCGNHAELQHARPLMHLRAASPKEIELAAVCDLRKDRAEHFQARYGFRRVYTDAQEMLAKENLDGVIAVMPIEHVVRMSDWLFEQRVPFTIEKPLGESLQAARGLVRTAEGSKTPHMVSVNRRFDPFLNQGLAWAKQAGEVKHIRARMLRVNRTEDDFIWGTAIHIVDTVSYLGGTVNTWDVKVTRMPNGIRWFRLRLSFKSGCTADIEVFPTAGRLLERYELFGDKFCVQVDVACGVTAEEATLNIWKGGAQVLSEGYSKDTPLWMANGAYDEAKAFVEALKTGHWPDCRVEHILPAAEICAGAANG